MELTTRGRYAVMAMADIACHDAAGAVPLSAVAERQRLPLPYLEQIFLGLRRSGLVESARGRSGGYRLIRPASEICVFDIMTAVDEETHFTRCQADGEGCIAGERCLTHELWKGLSDVAALYLKSMSLAEVIAGRGQTRSPPRRHYLDYNATVPMRPEARAALVAALDVVGNPSSVHAEGRRARGIVEEAREKVAALVGAKPSEVVFTSGATEANAAVFAERWETLLVSALEHDSVMAAVRASSAKFIEIPAGRDGVVRLDAFDGLAASHAAGGRALALLQFANNETGVIQPVAEFVEIAARHGLASHIDAVQAAGRIAVDFAALGATTMAISAHKLGGPKGAGALVIRDRVDLAPFIRGGGQERRRRGGTENVAAIAGFGAAAEAALRDLADMKSIAALRDSLEAGVRAMTPKALIIGSQAPRLANTSAIALPDRSAETLVIKLDLAGIAVSAGAACSSGRVGTSHVLQGMGLEAEIARGAIRVSLGRETTQEDIAAFLAAWKVIAVEPALAA